MPRHGPQGERGGLLSLLALCLEEVDDLCCVCLAGCVICLAAADGHEADVAVGINRVKDYVDLVRAGNLKLVVGINGAALLISDALGNSLGSRAWAGTLLAAKETPLLLTKTFSPSCCTNCQPAGSSAAIAIPEKAKAHAAAAAIIIFFIISSFNKVRQSTG